MDFELSEEQATLRDVSRNLLAASCPPELVRSVITGGLNFDDKLWARGTEMGWTGLMAPEEHGGAGQGIVELCLVAEELGRAVAPGPVVETALVAAASAGGAKAAELTGEFAEGRLKAGIVHHGSIVARSQGDDVVLSGRGTVVHAAAATDWLMVTVLGDESYLLLLPTADTETMRRATLDQTRTWYDVIFHDLRIPQGQVLSADRAEVQHWLNAITVLTAADALGVGERLLEMTVGHVTMRKQFGRALGCFQSIKHKVADMLTTLKGLRAATYYAAMTLDARSSEATLATGIAKSFASEGVPEIAGEALQAHGGIGFTWEHDLHLYLRRAKVDSVLFGDASYHHEQVLSLLENAVNRAEGDLPSTTTRVH